MATSKKRPTSGKKRAVKAGGASSGKKASGSKKGGGSKKTNYSEWFRSTNKPKTGVVALSRGVPQGLLKAVEYSAIDGWAIFEGDIALGTVEEMEATVADSKFNPDDIPTSGIAADETATRGIVITGPSIFGIPLPFGQFRWPGGIMPYEIASNLPNQKRITDAVKHYRDKTKCRLVPRDPSKHPNYVRFEDQGGCFSQVGMRGGKQIISLAPGCGAGSTIHEIGHAFGLWHEQSREDRTKFIKINFENITAGHEHNFNQHISDGDDVGKYDYGSIMHYPATAFSKNGKPTIVPLKAGASIGQRTGLSAGDIAALKFMYP
jgi:hypothetical protein